MKTVNYELKSAVLETIYTASFEIDDDATDNDAAVSGFCRAAKHLRRIEYADVEGLTFKEFSPYVNNNLEEMFLRYVSFKGCTFDGVDFISWNGHGVRFEDCTFKNCSIQDSNFTFVSMRNCELAGLEIMNSNVRGWGLLGCKVQSFKAEFSNLAVFHFRDCTIECTSFYGINFALSRFNNVHLNSVDFTETNLKDCEFTDVTSVDVKLPEFQIPQDCDLIGWKSTDGGVLKILVPADAKRTASVVGRKCRAERVKVIGGARDGWDYISRWDGTTVYRNGETVVSDSYDPDPLVECTHGIHFFLTREEAENW